MTNGKYQRQELQGTLLVATASRSASEIRRPPNFRRFKLKLTEYLARSTVLRLGVGCDGAFKGSSRSSDGRPSRKIFKKWHCSDWQQKPSVVLCVTQTLWRCTETESLTCTVPASAVHARLHHPFFKSSASEVGTFPQALGNPASGTRDWEIRSSKS